MKTSDSRLLAGRSACMAGRANGIISPARRDGGTGRHAWLRTMCPKGLGGSSPPLGTMHSKPRKIRRFPGFFFATPSQNCPKLLNASNRLRNHRGFWKRGFATKLRIRVRQSREFPRHEVVHPERGGLHQFPLADFVQADQAVVLEQDSFELRHPIALHTDRVACSPKTVPVGVREIVGYGAEEDSQMKGNRYTEEQIVRILQEVNGGKSVAGSSVSMGCRSSRYTGGGRSTAAWRCRTCAG